jgi:hypothetical protein
LLVEGKLGGVVVDATRSGKHRNIDGKEGHIVSLHAAPDVPVASAGGLQVPLTLGGKKSSPSTGRAG